MTWRHIKSAPTGGKSFLVWCPGNKCTYQVTARDGSFWLWCDSDRKIDSYAGDPTHWQPLPEPPSTESLWDELGRLIRCLREEYGE